MKLIRLCGVLTLAALFQAATPVRAAEGTFEEIAVLKTEFEPMGQLVNRGDGYFYGVARFAQNAKGGLLYRIAPGQETEIIHTFTAIPDDTTTSVGGSNPSCPLVLGDDGALYGATELGGAYRSGTVFRYSADGVFSVVRDLKSSECYDIHSLVYRPGGDLIGAAEGGANGDGVLFRIKADGSYQPLYAFEQEDLSPFEPIPEGKVIAPAGPWHLSLGVDGKIYGTTGYGGLVYSGFMSRYTYGTFFRYDGPGAITVLKDFGPLMQHPQSNAATNDGFLVTTPDLLVHIGFDGAATTLADFSSAEFGGRTGISPQKVLVRPDGIYGTTFYGGDSDAGYIYRYTPGAGPAILHEFTAEYRGRFRALGLGNDGLVYGVAAYPQGGGPSASPSGPGAGTAVAAAAAKKTTAPRAFRYRPADAASANFVPLARKDTAWLKFTTAAGQRQVVVQPLANDRDPDGDAVSLLSVAPAGKGTATLLPGGAVPRIRYTTSAVDPPSQLLSYQVGDGEGGFSTGYVAVMSPADGYFAGRLRNLRKPEAAPVPLSLRIGKGNTVEVTMAVGKKAFTGKGSLDVDDTADITLSLKGRTSKLLHLSLERGKARTINVRVVSPEGVYAATLRPSKEPRN